MIYPPPHATVLWQSSYPDGRTLMTIRLAGHPKFETALEEADGVNQRWQWRTMREAEEGHRRLHAELAA